MAIPEGPAYPSLEWTLRELDNYGKTLVAPAEQLDPAFASRWHAQGFANELEWLERGVADPSWFSPGSGNSQVTPVCASWGLQCAGDPFLYPGHDPFYENDGEVVPFVFYDAECARISGRVWAPRGSSPGDGLPAVVIENGSVQAPEVLYWWKAQALVRGGYAVMTFDPRGQGRSDQQTPTGEQGSNANSTVFWTGLVDSIDFLRSTPEAPYPHNSACAGTYPTPVVDHNPFHDRIDRDRLGLVGHSLGATGVSVVQGYGGPGADPWPGLLDEENPVDVIVAWDALRSPTDPPLGAPPIVPRVPAMGHTSEYGIGRPPLLEPPDPEGHKDAYLAWRNSDVPVYQLTIQGSTHFEWSPIPTFPSSSWCPEIADGRCVGGWGRPMAEHYTLAWLDRWLKREGEPGYENADARLLDDDGPEGARKMSFYWRSARSFPTRAGGHAHCEDVRAGCPDVVASSRSAPASTAGGCSIGNSDSGVGAIDLLLLAALGFVATLRRR